MIREDVRFGGILGRICSRPCEAVCNQAKVDGQSVAIRDLKRYLEGQNADPQIPPLLEERPQKVAVVGAGPARPRRRLFPSVLGLLRNPVRQGIRTRLLDRQKGGHLA